MQPFINFTASSASALTGVCMDGPTVAHQPWHSRRGKIMLRKISLSLSLIQRCGQAANREWAILELVGDWPLARNIFTVQFR